MPYVTNPYLIPHQSAALTSQIIKTMEMDWKKTLYQCFGRTRAATTAHLFTLSGLQTAEGRGHLPLSVLAPKLTNTHTHCFSLFNN